LRLEDRTLRQQPHWPVPTGQRWCGQQGAALVVKRLAKAVEHSQNGENMEALVPQFQEELAFGQKNAEV
jgi:hypothetical protein